MKIPKIPEDVILTAMKKAAAALGKEVVDDPSILEEILGVNPGVFTKQITDPFIGASPERRTM